MESIKHLLLYIDAPLQSWGYQSRFDRRTTLSYPTRSGILGLIAAALGESKENTRELNKMKEMRMTVYVIRYPQRIEDFQTIGGGYDKKKQRENIPRRADGSTGATVISRREYLADGKFGVQLSGAAENLAQIEKALKDPKWGIWFGRKSCIPSVPVCWGVFDEQEKLKEKLIEETGESPKKVIRETTRFSDGTDTIMDVPLDFNKRIFAVRRVSDI